MRLTAFWLVPARSASCAWLMPWRRRLAHSARCVDHASNDIACGIDWRQVMNCDSLLRAMPYRPTERTEARARHPRADRARRARPDRPRRLRGRRWPPSPQAPRVATGTVYRHFPSKAELFAEVFRRASQREVDATRAAAESAGGGACQRLAAAVETFARRALRGRRLAWALLAEPVDLAVEDRALGLSPCLRRAIRGILRRGRRVGQAAAPRTWRSRPPRSSARWARRSSGPISSPVRGRRADALVADLVASACAPSPRRSA